jgi:hypothetical protein
MGHWYPLAGSENDPEWWTALERVAALTQSSDELETIAACEFMFMGREDLRRGRRIWLYKHIATRNYLNIDDAGHAYRYVAKDLDDPGRYIAYRRLGDALAHLELDEVSTAWRYERCACCEQCSTASFPLTDGQLVH